MTSLSCAKSHAGLTRTVASTAVFASRNCLMPWDLLLMRLAGLRRRSKDVG